MGLSELDRYRFDLSGYLVFEDVLDPGRVGELLGAIEECGVRSPGPSVEDQRFGGSSGLLGLHQSFRDLIDHPLVLEILGDLIGPYARLDHSYGIIMGPGHTGFGLHGPAWPFDASQFYLQRGGKAWNGLLGFSWALTTAAPGEGGFGCIPGSHRAETVPPEGAEALAVEVPQRAGSLLIFTEALVHCTMPWTGATNRLSLLYKYSPGNSSVAPSLAATAEVLPLLTPRQRLLVESPYVIGRQRSY
jgi:hypothetical protein